MFRTFKGCTFVQTIKITKICLKDFLKEPILVLRLQRQYQEVEISFFPKAC